MRWRALGWGRGRRPAEVLPSALLPSVLKPTVNNLRANDLPVQSKIKSSGVENGRARPILRSRLAKAGLLSVLMVGVLITPVWLGLILCWLYLIARWLIG